MAAVKATVNFSFILTFRKMIFRRFWCSQHCARGVLEDHSVYVIIVFCCLPTASFLVMTVAMNCG